MPYVPCTFRYFVFIGLPFKVATYSKSSNLVFDVLIYLLKFDFDEVELLIYGLS